MEFSIAHNRAVKMDTFITAEFINNLRKERPVRIKY